MTLGIKLHPAFYTFAEGLERLARSPRYQNQAWLEREYINLKKSPAQIAKGSGVTRETISAWLRRFKFPSRAPLYGGFLEAGKESQFKVGGHGPHYTPKPYWDADWLRREFIDNCRTALEIAAEFQVGKTAIYCWLRHHNIPRPDKRNRSGTKICRLCGRRFQISEFRVCRKRKGDAFIYYTRNRCKECERHTPRGISGGDAKKLLAAQIGRCWWCSIKLNGRYEVDHRFAVARGGSHHKSNLVLSCRPCNRKKGTKTPWEFAGRLL